MDNRGKRQASSIFGGMGFYIALLVCVLAAGVVGYFALLDNNVASPAEEDPAQTVGQPDPGPAQSVSSEEEEPARSVLSEEPVIVPVTRPTPPEKKEETPAAGDSEPVIAPDPPADEPLEVVSPLSGETVAVFSADQLAYDATLGDWRTHDGIDIRAAAGTDVAAAAKGVVLSVEEDGRLGTTVIIEHPDGAITTYASLQQEVSVLAGDQVAAGDVIGQVGNTSLNEAGLGAHLHFSVMKDGEAIDPETFLGTTEE